MLKVLFENKTTTDSHEQWINTSVTANFYWHAIVLVWCVNKNFVLTSIVAMKKGQILKKIYLLEQNFKGANITCG